MSVVKLGNRNPQVQVDGVSVPAEHINQSVTTVDFWDGIDEADFVEHTLSTNNDRLLSLVAHGLGTEHRRFAVAIAELEQILATHSGGDAPTWVDSEDQALAAAIAHHFDCHIGEPVALLTTVGRDALHSQHLNTAAQPAAFNYMAITANSAAESAASTTLTAEIATAGGGLLRAQATYAHTASTNTTTLTKTFTANGSDTVPVTIAKIGIFNAATTGTLAYEKLLNATATLTISGDSVTITETVTAG